MATPKQSIGFIKSFPAATLAGREQDELLRRACTTLVTKLYERIIVNLPEGQEPTIESLTIEFTRPPAELGAPDHPVNIVYGNIRAAVSLAPESRQEPQEEPPAAGLTFPDRPIPAWLEEMIRQAPPEDGPMLARLGQEELERRQELQEEAEPADDTHWLIRAGQYGGQTGG